MMARQKIYCALLLTIFAFSAMAQGKKAVHILENIIRPEKKVWDSKEFKDKAFVFSIHIGVDAGGKVDTVAFIHGRDDHLMKLIDFEKIRKSLLKSKKFRTYTHTCLVLMVSIIRDEKEGYIINNGNQYLESLHALDNINLNRTNLFLPPLILSSANNH